MLAMQYSIELPLGYDVALVRARVEERSKLFAGLTGLVHKSYLLSENDMIYAPFYLWSDVNEARKFLFDDLFRGVITAFKRPRVRSWMVLDRIEGTGGVTPGFAVWESDRVAPEENLEALFADEKAEQAKLAALPGLHSHVTLLDAERWELVRYSLWHDQASAPASSADVVQHYEVLHAQGA